jgi:uncharacterized protein (DUF2235 family)
MRQATKMSRMMHRTALRRSRHYSRPTEQTTDLWVRLCVTRTANGRFLYDSLAYFMKVVACIALFAFLGAGCASTSGIDDKYESNVKELQGDYNKHKNIFIFLDGTANNKNSSTNVWLLFQLVRQNDDPQTTATYIEGVGSAEDAPIVETALGRGMEQRILKAYRFITDNYNPGDDIYIFGFSRGAHQARALAGLIAYAGIPAISDKDRDDRNNDRDDRIGNDIIELVKKKSDSDFLDKWRLWHPRETPFLAREIENTLKLEMQSAEIKFLGVWDTVPGSSLKNYGICKENQGFLKKDLYWLIPGTDKGERYKTDSYPAIRQIAHAVALDEKRSKFMPLLVCDEINAEYTKISEVWFPGAHADVGGGYEDSEGLSAISLEWMIQLLNKNYKMEPYPEIKGNAKGLAHWSIGDSPANKFSECVDRHPPADACRSVAEPARCVHPSVDVREKASPVPIRWKNERRVLNYPIRCSGQ